MTAQPYFIEQFVDEGLGNSSYLVGSHESKLGVLIDPLRDIDRYLAAAERHSVSIIHALDTHLHADFVSGAREIAAQTGALIAASLGAKLEFDHQPLVEGDELPMGGFILRVMETPGHTPEHVSFLVAADEGKTPSAIFTGGALIVGGAARTDLLGHELSQPLARQLYHTIHDKLLPLPDGVDVFPTHGAGSFCAAPTSSDRVTTMGRERRHNALAQPQSEEEFVRRALSGLPSYPVYYKYMRAVNQRGPNVLGGVPALKPLSPQEVLGHIERSALVLDVRPAREFGRGYVPGAYNIQVDAPVITWAGWLIPFGAQLIIVADTADERLEATRQLIRIGYDNLPGYLEGGLDAWAAGGLQTESVPSMRSSEVRERLRDVDNIAVLDVRQDSEWAAGHIPGATHIENGRLPYDDLPLPKDQPIAVHCAHGARSMAGISVLRRRGYHNVFHVPGGFAQWEMSGYEVERS